jgi:hypothetical protein
MPPEPKTPLSTADVRYLLNQWSKKGLFRIRRLGDRLSMLEVSPQSSYTVRLQTQYEERTVGSASEPYHGGQVDDHGSPPDPWSVPVRRPESFQERTDKIHLPHTDRVRTCPRCGGRSRIPCAGCGGSGRTTCPWCHGSGFKTRTEMRQVADGQGNLVPRAETVQETCSCGGVGTVACTQCNGAGTQTCPECTGSGRVKTFELLTVHFACPLLKEVLHGTSVPDYLLGAAHGTLLVDEQGEVLQRSTPLPPPVEQRVEEMLEKARPADPGKTRVLRQRLEVEQVNIQEVQYQHGGKDRRLWIYGDEQKIYAPGMPRPWAKLALIIGGVMAALVILCLVLPHLF